MACFIYTRDEPVSLRIAEALKPKMGFEPSRRSGDAEHFRSGSHEMVGVSGQLVDADFVDGLAGSSPIVFLSRHSSSKDVASLTAHFIGNWGDDVKIGGRARELVPASPHAALEVLRQVKRLNTTEVPVVYEATHHGPYLTKPALFVEMGGSAEMLGSGSFAELLASAAAEADFDGRASGKVAIGIGGLHYAEKFTRLALEGRYTFGHIMSRYHVENVDMIAQAVERSDQRPEAAVIEWKSLNSLQREKVIKTLDEIGIDYERA